MKITLRQLECFYWVGRNGHFGRAAVHIGITQPAVSAQIKQLEALLDVGLLERHTREVILTPQGRELLKQAELVLGKISAIEAVNQWQNGSLVQLAIGVIPSVAPYLVPQLLPEIRQSGLANEIRIHEAVTANLIEELRKGRLDAAIMALPSETEDMFEVKSFEDPFVLAGNALTLASLNAGEGGIHPHALDPSTLLFLDEGHCLGDQALELCGLKRNEPRTDLGASSIGTLAGLVANGFGLTFLPDLALVSECAAHPKLAIAKFKDPQPFRTIGLVCRRATRNSAWFARLAQMVGTTGTAIAGKGHKLKELQAIDNE